MMTTISPIDNQVCFQCEFTPHKQINQSINDMIKAQCDWETTNLSYRINILNRFLKEISLRRDEICKRLTIEMGRPIKYANGEVNGLLERANHMIEIATESLQDDIIDEYMSNISDSYQTKKKTHKTDKCKICKSNMLYTLTNSELICRQCGYTEEIIINSEKTSYKDPPGEVSYFAYKRINHFNEWLAQFQAKESTEIPDTVYRDIHYEIEKNINLNIRCITRPQVRGILKKLEYNKYYEHIPHIINILTGKKAPSLTQQEEEHLRSLFKEIQIPFSNNCPEGRKNFLSYSYVLHKFCELLEYDYLLPNFPLLKSREKLLQQDKIWRLICHDLHWQYIPSI